jgi:hypothetical protein
VSNDPHCGGINGHIDNIATAGCAYRFATTTAIRDHASSLGADPVAAVDLLAHLRAPLSDPDAYAVTRYVLALGWRPVVGAA